MATRKLKPFEGNDFRITGTVRNEHRRLTIILSGHNMVNGLAGTAAAEASIARFLRSFEQDALKDYF